MPYTVNIVVKDSDDIKKIANIVAEIVENATGGRVSIRINNRSAAIKQKKQEQLDIQGKLLK